MRLLLRFIGLLFAVGTILFLVGVAAAAGLLWHFSKDLPDYSQLQDYEPPVMTRVHAADGSLLAEYASERRLYLPIQAVPKLVINAFIAAEDKNFYEHGGIDFSGIARAGMVVSSRTTAAAAARRAPRPSPSRSPRTSCCTNELSFTRKIKEALLAMKIERTYSKDKILELYLNEIYLGIGAYGVAAASLLYFDKSVHELTLPEAAYLAALPKGPNNYNPFRHRDEAIERRNYVIDRMVENGYVTAQEGERRQEGAAQGHRAADRRAHLRGRIFRRGGAPRHRRQLRREEALRGRPVGAHHARSQAAGAGAQDADRRPGALRRDAGLSRRRHQDRDRRRLGRQARRGQGAVRRRALAARRGAGRDRPVGPHRLPAGARSSAARSLKERETGTVPLEGVKWAKRRAAHAGQDARPRSRQVLAPGDVVYVEPLAGKDGQFRLRQVPEISGAIVVMDPQTGRVLAMVGGFSYDQSQFNRATQALRQPGSSFKPIVYAAALDNGYTPSTVVMDAPLEIDTGSGVWRPENYEGKFYGPSTLRFGIEHSRNVMTVRLAQDIGMPLIGEYAKRFGVYDNLPPYLSFALGAGETTLLRMVAAYSMFANGGRKVHADADRPHPGPLRPHHLQARPARVPRLRCRQMGEPARADAGRQARAGARSDDRLPDHLDDGRRGPARHRDGRCVEVGKPIAGKTGTTNDEKDVWFVGFSPDLVVGVYMGYDKPRHIGDGATGGALAAPIVRDFLKVALADKPAVPFRVPAGIKLIRVDPKTGMRAGPGDSR